MFAALAISRHLQDVAGVSIKKLVDILRPLRAATIEIDGHTITAEPTPSPEGRELLSALARGDEEPRDPAPTAHRQGPPPSYRPGAWSD